MSFANNALDLCIKVIEEFHASKHPDCPGGTPSHAKMDEALAKARKALGEKDECPICGGDDEKLFPNLDDISDEDREHYADVFHELVEYCQHKTIACEDRRIGETASATYHEHVCEEIYNSLPKWARW